MENKNEVPEFDLDEILNEFHDEPAPDAAEVEPDEELEALLHLPELTITPVVVKDTSIEALLEDVPDLPVLEGDTTVLPEVALEGHTVQFAPIIEEAQPKSLTEDTIQIPEQEHPASNDETRPIGDLSAFLKESAPAAEEAAEAAPEEEKPSIPEPIPFRSRLRELKRQLVAGPEKRYYELSEVGTARLQIALLLNIAIVILCAGVTTMFALDMVPENRLRLVIFSQVLAMMCSALLGSHLMVDSIGDLMKGRFTVNTLLTLTFAACMIDGIFCLMELRVPCCAAFSLEMTMALWARLQRRNTEMAQMDTMRKAVRLTGIIKVENYYEGMDGLLRTEGEVDDFMQTYDKMTSPELVQSIYAALSFVACLGIAGFAGYLHGISMGVQILSTSLLVAVPATFFISTTRPMAILEKRLHMVGTVLCGWEGVKDLCGKAAFTLTDMDLFPKGSTKLNGVKFYGDREPDEVVSYSASLILRSGGGLVPVFQQLLKNRSCESFAVENFQNYGDGGIGGEVCGEPVLLGTLDFLQDMGVEIPEGTMVSQAVYASIDGQLSAVYAISYAKMRSAAAGLVTLCGYRKLRLLKVPGDFMLTESFLRTKFNVKTKRIRFLDREAAAELNRFHPDPSEPVLALATREELVSSAYAVTGARALRQSTKLGVILHLLGGMLGLITMLVLGYLGSTELLTPTNVLLYQLVWAVPGLLVTEWTRIV
ncbi:MAG: hypothetical protein IJN67_02185 [Oscillospiraceae bacterium]|nr:hypothetical protein [Oscillospiraceae bacterium]